MTSNVPAPTDFELMRSDGASWTFNVAFPAGAVSVDLNDYEIVMTARSAYDDASPLFTLSKAGGQIIVDQTVITRGHVTLSSDNSEDLPCPPPLYFSTAVYDLELQYPASDKPATIARGTIKFYADVTRNA